MQIITHHNGCVTLQSDLLNQAGITHAFSTRVGGTSHAPFDSLNVGQPVPGQPTDAPAAISENIRLLKAAIDCNALPLVAVRQVHGDVVHRVTPGDLARAEQLAINAGKELTNDPMLAEHPIEADAMISDMPDALVGVRMADCVPILVATRDGRCVAAVHAGWRGVVAGIAGIAIKQLCELADVNASQIVAAVGPCIGLSVFEVGHEVADAFGEAGLGEHVDRTLGVKPHIDLAAAVAAQLRSAGVEEIDEANLCTTDKADLFFSHRRDNGATGRMAAIIKARDPLAG